MVVHAYYPDLLSEVMDCYRILPEGTPLFVTVPAERYDEAAQILAGHAQVHLISSPNRGRDIAPFLTLLNSRKLDSFDAVLKLHTKRSPHLRDGDLRRRLLFTTLCGERNATIRALTAFCNPQVGMVGWGASFRKTPFYWMANRPKVAELASAVKAGDTARVGFFEGSMFWFRPQAFEPLRRLDLSVGDFEPESGQLDGALHHAIERFFSIAAWSAGYKVCDLRGRLLTGGELAGEWPKSSVLAVGKCLENDPTI